MNQTHHQMLFLFMIFSALVITGCAEGLLWRTGHLSPWVRQKWEEEEAIARTSLSRRTQMAASVEAVVSGTPSQQEQLAKELSPLALQEPILIVRLDAIDQLGKLNSQTAIQTLSQATKDGATEIRIAAVESLGQRGDPAVIPVIQEVLGSDTNVDVRLAATRALAKIPGERSAQALSLALSDSNPALQFNATKSLESVTGLKLGPDVGAWQNALQQSAPPLSRTAAAPTGGSGSRTAAASSEGSGSKTR